MADEVEMIPVAGAEPPKKVTTLKLNPLVRKPGAGATSALRPGLKLPPKPGAGATSALRPGLKLPPKPGAGATSAMKPGLKMPPKPVAVDAQGVGKLPTVEAKTIDRNDTSPVVSENPKPMEALKSMTQKLKGITQEIPQQAILHKTGIIADGAMSEGQREAAKHKTARISLSDAMGVAPVKDEAAPMKTIRIKRPIDISNPTTSSLSPQAKPQTGEASADVAAASAPEMSKGAEAAPSATVTQRKTIKIARPGVGAVRPSGKFGIKRPGSSTATDQKKTAQPAETNASDATDAAVADIPDISAAPMAPVPKAAPVSDGPAWLWTLSAIVQLAACGVVGALAWFLYGNAKLATFCGGLGWGV